MLKIEPRQLSLYSILYNRIPENHILKKIDSAVDFGFINKQLESSYCKFYGRPAKEPEMMCKLLILQWFRTVPMTHHGIEAGQVSFDYGKIVSKKDTVVRQLRLGVEALVISNGGTIINGRAVIKDKNTIEVTGESVQTITTGKIIIATGSRPAKLPIPGINSEKVFDSDRVLELASCPGRIVIIGGGVIGMEFTALFNSLGKEVTIIEMTDTILPGVDIKISSSLRKSLEKKGVKIYTGSKVTYISPEASASCNFRNNGQELKTEGDIIILAIGRKPNSEGIGLENAGIAVERGFIKVHDRLETTVEGIYAIGDVTGKVQLAHAASTQGLVAAANAAGRDAVMDYSVKPSCIYTSPEIAFVGLSEADALKKGYALNIGRFPVALNGKSIIMGEKEGFCKIIANKETGEILGVHIMGPRATEMISEACLAMKLESTIEEVADTIHPHPTVNEIMMEAAHDIDGACIHKPKRKVKP